MELHIPNGPIPPKFLTVVGAAAVAANPAWGTWAFDSRRRCRTSVLEAFAVLYKE